MRAYDSFLNYSEPAYGTIFAGHFNESDRYATRRPAGMPDWLIAYTVEGAGYFRTAAGEWTCSAGDICLLRGGVPHEYGTAPHGRWNFIWAHFPGLAETELLPEGDVIVWRLGGGYLRRRVGRAMRNVLQDSREQPPLWQLLCENELRGIVLLLASWNHRKLDPRIEEALQYLSRSFKTPLRIADVARAVGLSASRLSHLFKQETGATLVEKWNDIRIRHAAMLIRHSGRTPTEAAYDAGFRNYNHFAALFRQRMGMSPRVYRNGRDGGTETDAGPDVRTERNGAADEAP